MHFDVFDKPKGRVQWHDAPRLLLSWAEVKATIKRNTPKSMHKHAYVTVWPAKTDHGIVYHYSVSYDVAGKVSD